MLSQSELLHLFKETRKDSENICSFLETEDYVVQPIVDVSPPKWHLGHTTWFFEEFVLKKYAEDHTLFDENTAFVFNSYYESVGKKVVRTDRGNLSRPTVAWIYKFREYVTTEIIRLLENNTLSKEALGVLEIGCHHEKQHQELLYADIKYILGNNPLMPEYNQQFEENPVQDFEREWVDVAEGIYEIGHTSEDFCYDNELGVHKIYLHDFSISNKLVTNSEYMEFVEAGGYDDVLLWHAEAWDWVNTNEIKTPFYWHKIENIWHQYTLGGLKPLNPDAPVTHISYYEAFAYAQWKGMRLPTEQEWEISQKDFDWGSRWEWTESSYSPYPNYQKADGALGEYNGKFMVNQKVLRGASVATSSKHSRYTYRNFFHPQLRWQFTGFRLVK
ncbi:ergothioneine biosynthesis protein EgtB [uncultured Christiangramia sp.]|uniref:ergothioneine biosynthesis protein EgtB n=1 Tax=uncultured Christiangramia sp. TaxID=503836 RepID=UPI0025EE5444|nr:ergothioneine biosynthesis protein EgtB [uncultured Christiangramia sp.]|tara:strand:+ start:712 stop:1875 length:1164 start_codon:yes stop_codon:yes gene_type:complete